MPVANLDKLSRCNNIETEDHIPIGPLKSIDMKHRYFAIGCIVLHFHETVIIRAQLRSLTLDRLNPRKHQTILWISFEITATCSYGNVERGCNNYL
jgi:hypothetical protein